LLHTFGLDRPLHEQYVLFVVNLFQGELGHSFFYKKPVGEVIMGAFVNTLALTLGSLIVAYIFGIIAGAAMAWKRGTWIEGVGIPTVLVTRAAPEFWLGMLLLAIFSFNLGWFPGGGANSAGAEFDSEWARIFSVDFMWHLALPAFALALHLQGLPLLLMRTNMLEVMQEDFVTMARMKGLSSWTIVIRHAARNAHAGQAVELIVDDRYLEVRTEDGDSAVFDRLADPPEMSGDLGDASASAVLSGDKLFRGLWGSLQLPRGLPEDVYWPALKVGIKDGHVIFSRDWRLYELGQMTFREVALTSTSTETPAVGIIPYSIRDLSQICCGPDAKVSISIEADHVCFETPDYGWVARVPVVETGAARWTGAVESALNEAELEWTIDDSGQIHVVHWGEPAIVVSFYDFCPETLRIARLVAEDLPDSLEVHQEINGFNIARVGVLLVRSPDGDVVALKDLPCCRHRELVSALDNLRKQTEGLCVLFDSLRD
ncbi:MAG TPA: hypothetical protein DCP37_09625, partial [Dehalococcoidia bacterium]|nr:hypothetical protein [Dehalococcoidia bacterium]